MAMEVLFQYFTVRINWISTVSGQSFYKKFILFSSRINPIQFKIEFERIKSISLFDFQLSRCNCKRFGCIWAQKNLPKKGGIFTIN